MKVNRDKYIKDLGLTVLEELSFTIPDKHNYKNVMDKLIHFNELRRKEGLCNITVPYLALNYIKLLVNSQYNNCVSECLMYRDYQEHRFTIRLNHFINRFYLDNLFSKEDQRIQIIDTSVTDTIFGIWAAPEYYTIIKMDNTYLYIYTFSDGMYYNRLMDSYINLYRKDKYYNYSEERKNNTYLLPENCTIIETTPEQSRKQLFTYY